MRFSVMIAALIVASSIKVSAQAPKAKPAGGAAPAGNAENGKNLWVHRGCWQCHGYGAQGGADSSGDGGPRVDGRVPPFAYFLKYIRRPTEMMPPFTAKVLSDQQAADIYAWLKSLPKPLPVSSIPELK